MGISSGSAYDLFLSRSIQHAELIHAPDPNGAFELILSGKVDVLAGVRQHLVANAEEASRIAGARRPVHGDSTGPPVFPKAATPELGTCGIHRAIKASGLVARAIEKAVFVVYRSRLAAAAQ